MEILLTVDKKIRLGVTLKETQTARKIYDSLPIEGQGNTWGEEIYFVTSLKLELEDDSRDVLEPGELGYWPDMQAFCIFYGPTPASQGDEIRAAGPVNVFGRIDDDLSSLKSISGPVDVIVEKKQS